MKLKQYLKKCATREKIHLGLKYLGYETEYTDKFMINLIPKISKIVNKYLPMKIEVDRLGGFWDSPKQMSCPVIFLKVRLTKELKKFHNELNDFLRGKVDNFVLAEGENYTPHITLGNGKVEYINDLRELVEVTKFVKTPTFIVNKFAMRLTGSKTRMIKY